MTVNSASEYNCVINYFNAKFKHKIRENLNSNKIEIVKDEQNLYKNEKKIFSRSNDNKKCL